MVLSYSEEFTPLVASLLKTRGYATDKQPLGIKHE